MPAVSLTRRSLPVAAGFVTFFAMAPIASGKVVTLVAVGSFRFEILAGMALMVLAYGLRDVLHASRGRATADATVASALLVRAVVWAFMLAVVSLPGTAKPGFGGIVYEGAWTLLAGELSVLPQLFVDPVVFDAAGARWRSFVARSNASNLASQTLGVVIFVGTLAVGKRLGLVDAAKPLASVLTGGVLLRVVVAPAIITLVFAPLAAWMKESA